jgi:hypothetical protein
MSEFWRPGNVGGGASNPEVKFGRLSELKGSTNIVLPGLSAGQTWSGVSVILYVRPTVDSPIKVPIYYWDIAGDNKGSILNLMPDLTRQVSSLSLSSEASLFAKLEAFNVQIPTGQKVWLWGTAIESNQYG